MFDWSFTQGICRESLACSVTFHAHQINWTCWFTKGSLVGTEGSVYLKFGLTKSILLSVYCIIEHFFYLCKWIAKHIQYICLFLYSGLLGRAYARMSSNIHYNFSGVGSRHLLYRCKPLPVRYVQEARGWRKPIVDPPVSSSCCLLFCITYTRG